MKRLHDDGGLVMRKIIGMTMLAAAVAGSVFCGGCKRPEKGGSGGASLQVKGSDTMVNLGQAWAETYMDAHKDASVAVTGGGSGAGIAAMLNGTADIAESSRSMKDDEMEQAKKNGITPKEFKVGFDGIAVVVNPLNAVSSLTIDQLADIFTGKIANWKDVGGADQEIVVLSREVNSGTHVYFKEHVLNKGDSKGTVEFVPTALMISSSQGIADEVAQNAKAIGYYGMGYISDKQKVVNIAGADGKPVEPTAENVLSGAYPISRPLFVYTKGEPAGLAKEFVDFILSPEGQEIVKKLDFVPLQ